MILFPNASCSNTFPVKLCQDTNRFNSKLSRTPVRRRNDKNFEKCINSLFRFPGRGCVEPPLGITLLSSIWSAAKTSKSQKALPLIGVPAMGIIYNYMIFNWFHFELWSTDAPMRFVCPPPSSSRPGAARPLWQLWHRSTPSQSRRRRRFKSRCGSWGM